MAEPARKLWTLDEFLAFDDGTDTRYELFQGHVIAMAPASDVHGALVHAPRPSDREWPATGVRGDRRGIERSPRSRTSWWSSTEPRVEHYRREPDGWKVQDLRDQGTLRIGAFDLTIDLAELYAGVLPPGGSQAEGGAGS